MYVFRYIFHHAIIKHDVRPTHYVRAPVHGGYLQLVRLPIKNATLLFFVVKPLHKAVCIAETIFFLLKEDAVNRNKLKV